MLFTLLLLHYNCALEVEIVFLFKDIKERWIGASVDTNFLEFVSKVVLDRLLLEIISLHNDIVLAFEYEAIYDKVLLLKQVCFLEETHDFLCINVIVTLLDIHSHKV